MNYKKILMIIVGMLCIYFSYNYLSPLSSQLQALDKSEYKLETKHVKYFFIDNKGNFQINTANSAKTKAKIFFYLNRTLSLKFYIRKGSQNGDIAFELKKNNRKISQFVITSKQQNDKSITLSVKKGDFIEIIADKHGKVDYDWGTLEIEKEDYFILVNTYLIPITWMLFFIFLVLSKYEYLALNSYLIFILLLFSEKLNFGLMNFFTIFSYMLISFVMTWILLLLYQFKILKRLHITLFVGMIITLFVYGIPLAYVIYALNFGTNVTNEILYAVFQSNGGESYEFIVDYIDLKYILFFTLFFLGINFLLYKQELENNNHIDKSLNIFIIFILIGMSIVQFEFFRLPHFVISGFNKYRTEIQHFKDIQEKREDHKVLFHAIKSEEGETYIVMIGESLHKGHMGLYGYARDTTPLLNKINETSDLLIFNKAYSNHTVTTLVLSLALTEANQYNGKTYYDSLSILDILKKSGVESYWLTGQSTYGAFDNMISVLAKSADYFEPSDVLMLDGQLIEKVKKILAKKSTKNRVIFIHFLGSHYSYNKRYPIDEYTYFKMKPKLGYLGKTARNSPYINSYDNSIIYNDYVVSSIVKEIQKIKSVAGLLYLSDHGENIVNNKAHNPTMFSFEMTQIPMIAWFNKSYRRTYPTKYENLIKRKNVLFSNDLLYDTLIGIFGIQTDKYEVNCDFTSDLFTLKEENALTLHRKKHYNSNDNYIYWQEKNIDKLLDINQSARIFPKNINSLGKLQECCYKHIRSFSLNVHYDVVTDKFYVINENKITKITFEDYLNSISLKEIQNIILSIDNNKLGARLNSFKHKVEYLVSNYNLNNRLIIENYKTINIEDIPNSSFLMQDLNLEQALLINDETLLKNRAKEILNLVQVHKIKNISFSKILYPFIKSYLEPLLGKKDLKYIIHTNKTLKNNDFIDTLFEDKIYLDEKVKIILVNYKSQF